MKNRFLLFCSVIVFLLNSNAILACTGIRLIAKDGGVVYGRTMEWGSFDMQSRIAIIPSGYKFTGTTPDGENGKQYVSKYGFVALDIIKRDFFVDGMNEKGLAIGMFYHPGYAQYQEYIPSERAKTLSSVDVPGYILSQYSNVEEVKQALASVRVVNLHIEDYELDASGHWMVTDATGKSIVIEYTNGELKIYDQNVGIITNAPNYDWHLTNLSNYVNLSMFAVNPINTANIKISPVGGGSGLLGLPGDNTPPSRFVRAFAWAQLARPTVNAADAVDELIRILDNFQLPASPDAAEGTGIADTNMHSTTLWTTAWNLTDLTLNYHTQYNRRLRQLDLKTINFSKIGSKIIHIKLDEKKAQDIEQIKI